MNFLKITAMVCICFISMLSYASKTDHGHGKGKKHHDSCCEHEHHGKSDDKKHHGHDCDDKYHGKHDHNTCCGDEKDESHKEEPNKEDPKVDKPAGISVVIGGKEYKIETPGPFKIPKPVPQP